MGGRTLPIECEHGVEVDAGDFGPCQDCNEHEGEACPNFQTCERCEADRCTRDRLIARALLFAAGEEASGRSIESFEWHEREWLAEEGLTLLAGCGDIHPTYIDDDSDEDAR